ncbi:EpsG family protein [Ralstonia sp. Ralssp110]|uniref:EpsG family protein n=1 Tax=Ralstonia sp. Ralssp110 TaxID=3243004 RepID=UPI0039B511F4
MQNDKAMRQKIAAVPVPGRRRRALFPTIASVLFLAGLLVPPAALRLGLQTADTDVYLQQYGEYDLGEGLLNGPFEPAFMFLSWVGKELGANSFQYLWIVALVGVLLKLLGIYRSSHFFWLSILVYISKYFLLHEMTQMRAGIATGIFLYSLPMLHRRDGVRYFFCSLTATAFHQSAIIYLLIYPICKESKRKILSLSMVIGIGLMFSLLNANGMLFEFLSNYIPKIRAYLILLASGEYADINLFNAEIILKIFVWCVILSRYDRLSNRYYLFDVLFKVWTMSIVLYFALASVPVFAFRVGELLDVVAIPLLPALIVAFDRVWIGLGIFFSMILFWVVNYYFVQPIFL